MRIRKSTRRNWQQRLRVFVSHSIFWWLQNSSTGGLTVDYYDDVDADIKKVKPNRIWFRLECKEMTSSLTSQYWPFHVFPTVIQYTSKTVSLAYVPGRRKDSPSCDHSWPVIHDKTATWHHYRCHVEHEIQKLSCTCFWLMSRCTIVVWERKKVQVKGLERWPRKVQVKGLSKMAYLVRNSVL